MCVIVYKPLKVSLDFKDIDQMWSKNHDGAGIAYYCRVDGKEKLQIAIQKGFMKLKHLKDALHDLFPDMDNSQFALHFRNATHGGVTEELTHPFTIDKNLDNALGVLEETYPNAIMHNGVIRGYGSKDISDTLDFVINMLAYVEEPARPKLLELIPSKFLLMQHETFHFCGDWEDYKGLRVSNTHWNWSPAVTYYPEGNYNKKSGFHSAYTNIYDDNVIELDNVKEITINGEVITDPIKVREELEKDTWQRYCDSFD